MEVSGTVEAGGALAVTRPSSATKLKMLKPTPLTIREKASSAVQLRGHSRAAARAEPIAIEAAANGRPMTSEQQDQPALLPPNFFPQAWKNFK